MQTIICATRPRYHSSVLHLWLLVAYLHAMHALARADDDVVSAPQSTLTVSVNFPGGSAEVRSIDVDAGAIHIHPSLHHGRGWPCWWYVCLEGAHPDQLLTLSVSANPQPFRAEEVLSADWAQPDRAAISTDNVRWSQTPPCQKLADGSAVYQFRAPAEKVWLAWGPPFLPSHADNLLSRMVQQLPLAERFVLATTRGNRPVQGIRIGAVPSDEFHPYGVWVQARQHAWEAGSSWVGQGFLEWAASDAPAAEQLRQMATIYFIPVMDVDNVLLGAGGKESLPQDHNRDWSDQPYHPEIAAAQHWIAKLNESGHFDVFLDLHNPGPPERQPYFFGPFELAKLPAIQQRNYARWLAIANESISDPLSLVSEYKFATYVQSDELRRRISASWVLAHTAPHTLSTTLETVWNTPHSTQAGYQVVGRQLAQALARYLVENPRRP